MPEHHCNKTIRHKPTIFWIDGRHRRHLTPLSPLFFQVAAEDESRRQVRTWEEDTGDIANGKIASFFAQFFDIKCPLPNEFVDGVIG